MTDLFRSEPAHTVVPFNSDTVAMTVDELRDTYFVPMARSAAVLDGVCGTVTVHRVYCSDTHALHICSYFYAVVDTMLDRVVSLTLLEQPEQQRKPQRAPPPPLRRSDDTPSTQELADSVSAALHCSFGSSRPHPRRESLASSSRSTDYCLDPTSVLLPNVCCHPFLFFLHTTMTTTSDDDDDNDVCDG